MKKLVLSAVMAVCLLSFGHAQDIKYGVKGGLNFANIFGDNIDNPDTRTSFHFGGLAEIVLTEKISVQPELLFSAQGANSENLAGSIRFELKLSYLNLPIIFKYYITEGLSLEAGPQLGFLLSSKVKLTAINTGESVEDPIEDDTKGTDFGLNLGAGYKLQNGLNFALRYNFSLSSFMKNENFYLPEQTKNVVFQLSVGYMF